MNNFLLTMNVSRRCVSGEVREEEVINQSQVYISNSITIKKLIEVNSLNCWETLNGNQQLIFTIVKKI